MSSKKKILFVFSSAAKNLRGEPTGWYLPEAAHPYYVLIPHHHVDFAAPDGPNPPVDPVSAKQFQNDEDSKRFENDPVVKEKLDTALKLRDVKESDYDAIFYVGGHGPMIDLATDATSINLASDFFRSKKPTAAVCHGPAALVNATDVNNISILKGRTVTAFSNVEEEAAGMVKAVPFLLEDKIKEKGANYTKASEPWGANVEVDGHLITGENPNSARGVGEAILEALS